MPVAPSDNPLMTVASAKLCRMMGEARGAEIFQRTLADAGMKAITTAEVGEQKLMFFETARDGALVIAYSGRGRRDVEDLEMTEYYLSRRLMSSTFVAAGDTLPASLLHCRSRDAKRYDDCLVIARQGYDIRPRERGEHLSASFNSSGRLSCTRMPF